MPLHSCNSAHISVASRLVAVTFAILVLLDLAACGKVPQPFRDAPRATTNNPLLDMPTAVGIAVLPVTQVPAPFAGELSSAVANGLQTHDIPAEAVDRNAGLGFTLTGEAQDVAESPEGVTATIVWTLRSRKGAAAGNYNQRVVVAANAWHGGDADTSTRLGAEAASAINAIVGGDSPVENAAAAPPKPRFPRVSIKSIDGAPGDGGQSLRLAILQVLFEHGVTRDDVAPEVLVTCSVTSTPAGAEAQKVQIVWRATAPDGREMGTVKLDNTVPNGALEGAWGPTAFAIANASIRDLLTLITVKLAPAAHNAQTP